VPRRQRGLCSASRTAVGRSTASPTRR
jgi:hypothetical protein